MNIGIITFHFVPNQGAVLQCYALQQYLKSEGHITHVIDYQPGYHTVRYKAKKNPFLYARWYWKRNAKKRLLSKILITGKSFLRCIYMNFKGEDATVEKLFHTFINNNLNLTSKYTSYAQLKNNPPKLDAYISGSDQLWNPELLDQKYDKAYFLDFGDQNIPKIAYAVSIGKEPEQRFQQELGVNCEALTAVSIREYNEATIKAIGRKVHLCIDPTLLLDPSEYDKIIKEHTEHEPYIFVYGFETTDHITQAVKDAQEKYHCKVINGSPHRVILHESCKTVREYAPDQFLSYIKHAECVVTNSFHASVFSIIYHKDFITVPHSTRGLRMNELLSNLGLKCRLWGNSDFDFSSEINWNTVNQNLSLLRKESINYLESSLMGKRGEDID